jgi:HSP20 family protein
MFGIRNMRKEKGGAEMKSMVRWDPFRELDSLRDEFGRFFGPGFLGRGETGMWSPAVDVIEEVDTIVLKAELPGMSPDEVEIECEDDLLTIKGERKFEEKSETEGHRRIERGYGRFERSFGMPKTAKLDAIDATFKDGILEIRVPKEAEIAPKKIPITTQ